MLAGSKAELRPVSCWYVVLSLWAYLFIYIYVHISAFHSAILSAAFFGHPKVFKWGLRPKILYSIFCSLVRLDPSHIILLDPHTAQWAWGPLGPHLPPWTQNPVKNMGQADPIDPLYPYSPYGPHRPLGPHEVHRPSLIISENSCHAFNHTFFRCTVQIAIKFCDF